MEFHLGSPILPLDGIGHLLNATGRVVIFAGGRQELGKFLGSRLTNVWMMVRGFGMIGDWQ